MISTRLVQLIEGHRDEIAQRLIAAVRNHPDMQEWVRDTEVESREGLKESR
jgi:hypothetical protein